MGVAPWTLLILAKAPMPGFSKTRLCPPLRPTEAAEVAEAALVDTLRAANDCDAAEVLVAFAGDRSCLQAHPRLSVFEQVGRDLNERLERAWAHTSGWVVQIGSDTPHLEACELNAIAAQLVDHDAVLGPAEDGGWWVLAQREHKEGLFRSVTMSTPHTFDEQLASLRARHERVALAPTKRDLDHWPDALHIAATYPSLQTSARVRSLTIA